MSINEHVPRPKTSTKDRNHYLDRQDQLDDARKKWFESEYLLNFLRTQGHQAPKTPTDNELLEWTLN